MIVLKVMGIVLLVLLALVIGAVLLVLLVPIRYSLAGSYDGAVKGKGTLTWFLHAVFVTGIYEEGLDVTVRVLGRPLGGRKKPHKPDPEEEPRESGLPQAGEARVREDIRQETGKEQLLEELQWEKEEAGFFDEEEGEKSETGDNRRGLWKGKKKRKKKDRANKKRGDSPKLRESLRKAADSLREKWSRLREKKETVEAFLADKENQKTIRLLLRQTKALLCHILPRKVRGNLTLGFEDPWMTGNALAALSILYVWYGDAVKVTPVFDEAVLLVDGTIKGRLRPGTILVLVIRVLLNKNFRLLVRRWRGKRGK